MTGCTSTSTAPSPTTGRRWAGAAPKRVFLAGGSSQLPYLDLFIADKLSLPVAYFNPLRNVSLGAALDRNQLQQDNCYTAELVGLALRETGSCPAEISLEAPTLAARAAKRRKQPFYFGALLAWTLLFVCLGIYYYRQNVVAQETAQVLRQKTQELQGRSGKINDLVAQFTNAQTTLDGVVKLGRQRNAWPQILAALNDKIPSGVWITQLTPSFEEAAAAPETGTGGPGRQPPARRR